MSREIDSFALGDINKLLGIAGRGSSQTLLEDGHLQQVIDVRSLVRRSRSLAGTEGIFQCLWVTAHGAGASTLEVEINPYRPLSGTPVSPYPVRVRRGFDFWACYMTVRSVSGTITNASEAVLTLNSPASHVGFGEDDSGSAILTAPIAVIARFDSGISEAGSTFMITADGEPRVWLNQRIRRGATLQFLSTASNPVTLHCTIACTLVPSAVGQDLVT